MNIIQEGVLILGGAFRMQDVNSFLEWLQGETQPYNSIDLSGITVFDSALLSWLVVQKRCVHQRGEELKLLSPSKAMRELARAYELEACLFGKPVVQAG